MNHKTRVIEDEADELETEVRYYATVAGALGERVSSFANKLAAEGLSSQRVRYLAHEVTALQEAVLRALMELNNAAIAGYEASRNR